MIMRLVLLSLIIYSCTPEQQSFKIDEEYISNFPEEISPDRNYYLQMMGLFELNPSSENSFGSDSTNTFVIQNEFFPSQMGRISLLGENITFNPGPGVNLLNQNGDTIISGEIQLNDVLNLGRWHFTVIERAKLYFLRLWDSQNPAIEDFLGFETFDLNAEYIYSGQFRYYPKPIIEMVDSELGKREIEFIGEVEFTAQDQKFTMIVMEAGFFIVGDQTNNKETYSGGRYMYLDLPEKDGKVIIDFNYLYNPSCSFSEYTTCLFPPTQNMLPFEVKAGELYEKGKEYFLKY